MAIVQTVMWTAVPNGIDASSNKLKVRCVVSPRLSSTPPTNQALSAYADWPQWTAKVAAAGFTLSLKVGGVTYPNLVPDKAILQPALWPALFRPTMLVRPFTIPDFTTTKIRSYPVGNVLDAVRRLYSDLTNERPLDQGPSGSDWTRRAPIRDIRLPRNSERTLLSTVDNLYRNGSTVQYAVPPGPPQAQTDFLQVRRFHWTPATAAPVPPKPTPAELDFHQLVALLMEYPILQRRLGLTLDFLVPVGGLVAGDTTVSIVAPSPGHLTPTTAATYGAGYFWPKAGGDVANNRLAIAGANFSVVSVDVDGAALKLAQFADAVTQVKTAEPQFLPSLRSAGLAVARTGKAWQFNAKFGKAKQDNTTITGGGPVTLDAASLLHGLRWQAYDVAAQQWFSLCERDVRYRFLSLPDTDAGYVPGRTTTLREEGPVTAAMTQRVNDGTDDLYLAEYLARWHGENLVAPRPGLSLLEPGQGLADPHPGPQSATDPQLNVDTTAAPQGLPVLRFGRDYRLRAMATYIGGAGVAFQRGDTSADFTHATGVYRYARAEPIAAPEVVACAAMTPGETITDLVIRTEYDSAPADTAPADRHLLPPKVAQLFAEQLGLFDTDTGFDPATYPVLAARADGAVAGGSHPANVDLPVPWLPDIHARGAALYGAPGGGTATIAFGLSADSKNWQSITGVHIRLQEGSAPATVPSGRGVVMKVGKGDVVEIALSSFLAAAHLNDLQIWRWFVQTTAGSPKYPKSGSDPYGNYVDWATSGLLWTITPYRRVRLICAVRQPIVVPAHVGGGIVAQPGDNAVTLGWQLAVSRKTTTSVDVSATWSDPVDVLSGGSWSTHSVAKSAAFGDAPVVLADATHPEGTLDLATLPGGGLPADLHDTKAHLVTFRLRAKSRFAEYFPDPVSVVVTPSGQTPVPVNARGITEGSEVVTAGQTTYERGVHYQMDYVAGTLTRTAASPISGPVTVTFRPSLTRTGTFQTWVPARTRPVAPAPVEALPTFGWDRQVPSADPNLPGAVLSRRSGNGLRIYVAPPWYSSGAEEKLGIVFSANAQQIAEHLRPFVTGWAGDPAFTDGSLGTVVPQPSHVTGNPVVSEVVTLPDLPDVAAGAKQVRVVELNPSWDADRQLYYGEVEFAPPGSAYFPFIRLALCRFQPHGLTDLRMSPVRLLDFAQLAPDRSVSLTYPSATQVAVTVVGCSYLQSFSSARRGGQVRVTVEWRDPAIDGELAWTAIGGAQLTPGVPWAKDPSRTAWTGTVSLPAPHSDQQRLVVQEYESVPGGERVVFTDVIALT